MGERVFLVAAIAIGIILPVAGVLYAICMLMRRMPPSLAGLVFGAGLDAQWSLLNFAVVSFHNRKLYVGHRTDALLALCLHRRSLAIEGTAAMGMAILLPPAGDVSCARESHTKSTQSSCTGRLVLNAVA